MNLSREQKQAKLGELCEAEGFDSIEAMLEGTVVDSVSPPICTICGYTAEMELDQDRGFCERCSAKAVVSALILPDII